MILYEISEKGELIKINKLEFAENDIYLVDDDKTIYIWIGTNVSLNKQDISVKKARILNKKRGGSAKLLLIRQNKEYGAFMAMMTDLKEGLKEDNEIERRPELVLEKPKDFDERKLEPEKEPEPKPQQVKVPGSEVEGRLNSWLGQQVNHRASTEAITKKAISEVIEDEEIEVEAEQEPEEEDSFEDLVRSGAYFLSQESRNYEELCWYLAKKQMFIQMGEINVKEEDIKTKAEQVYNTSCTYEELCWLISELTVMEEKHYFDEF